MNAIILNGYHAGEQHSLRSLIDPLFLHKPKRFIECSCNEEEPSLHDLKEERQEYKLTFISKDRTWGLYTTTGDPREIVKSRDWVLDEKRQFIRNRDPIYIDCRDERAWL